MRLNMARWRKRRGLSLEQLAQRLAAIGWPLYRSSLSKIERGARRVDVDDLTALAAALGVTPADLLLGDAPATGVPSSFDAADSAAWLRGHMQLTHADAARWWGHELQQAERGYQWLKRQVEDDPEGALAALFHGDPAEQRRTLTDAKQQLDVAQQHVQHHEQATHTEG